jgi:[acyl-carrier-protein] S-malonyltransferase
MNIAFLFPGQGAQYAGMGKELYGQYEEVRLSFEEAAEAAGRDVWAMCLDENAGMLPRTRYVQPAMVALEAALARLMAGRFGVKPKAVAGLSLGEYAALYASGSLTYVEAVRLAAFRGMLMEECAAKYIGSMAAVLGLGRAQTEDACIRARNEGESVWPCNYNCPGQIVIGGLKAGVERASQIAGSMGAKRVLPLNVSGAFHTPVMSAAADAFRPALAKAKFAKPDIPAYSNVTARPHEGNMREELAQQIVSPVLWEDTLRALSESGIDTFVEIGPGKTLTGFVRKTLEGVPTLNVEDAESLKKTLEALEAGA